MTYAQSYIISLPETTISLVSTKDKSEGEPALLSAITLSTHIKKQLLNLNACSHQTGTRRLWHGFREWHTICDFVTLVLKKQRALIKWHDISFFQTNHWFEYRAGPSWKTLAG